MYKIKRFSSLARTWSGLKSAGKSIKYGLIGGGAISLPIAGLISLFGNKKAALITAGVGTSIGAGIAAYAGYTEGVESYDYDQKLKNDPEFRRKVMEKDKRELNEYIKYQNSIGTPKESQLISEFKNIESRYGMKFKSDLYSYIKFYSKFESKYRKIWSDAWKDLDNKNQIDVNFNYVFPEPNPEAAFNDISQFTDLEYESGGVMIAGSYEESDHSYLFYIPKFDEYEFSLGFSHKDKSISKSISNFSKVWLSDLNKIKDEKIKKVAQVHNKIINEFINGLKSF